MKTHTLPVVIALLAAAGCDDRAPEEAHLDAASSPADTFFASLTSLCGRAYAGQVTVDQPPPEDDPFAGNTLIMHVRDCSEQELKIPFHVGEDRSRTWLLTRTGEGLRLKHEHRHEDGTPDTITLYGGDTSGPGTDARQEFPVDEGSIELFEREGLSASLGNVWAMEIEPDQRFVYELARPATDRLFRVEFDLTAPVEAPPRT